MAKDGWIPYDTWPPEPDQLVTLRFISGEIRRNVRYNEHDGWFNDEYQNIVPPHGGFWRPQ